MLKVGKGDKVISSDKNEIHKVSDVTKNIPAGTIVHNIELTQKVFFEVSWIFSNSNATREHYTLIKLGSGETRKVYQNAEPQLAIFI